MSSSSTPLIEFDGPERLDSYSCKYDLAKGLTYHPDKSALRHFVSPCEGENDDIDLIDGFPGDQRWKQKSPSEMFVFKWFKLNYKKTGQKNPDFICHSQTLRSFLSGDFKDKNDCTMFAVKVGDSIIIETRSIHKHRMNHSERVGQRPKTKAGLYTDRKFIELSTRCQDDSEPVTGPGGYRDTFHSVNRSQIGDHTLLYSHPVHCVIDKDQYEKPLDEMKFAKLALRSGYYWNHSDEIHVWHRREIRWWSEYILSGVVTILCGEKGRKNRLERILRINAESLSQDESWTQNECFKGLDSILSLIKKTVTKECVPYKFEHCPNEGLTFTESGKAFLPWWYIKCFEMSFINIGQWFSKQTMFDGPKRLSYFSTKYDNSAEQFTYHADKSALRYYVSPFNRNEVDLLEGFFHHFKQRRTKKIDMFILRWFVDNYNLAEGKSSDFICQSTLIRLILHSTRIVTINWELIAIKVGDSIIIEEVPTEQLKKESDERFDVTSAEILFSGSKYIEISTRYQDESRMTIDPTGYRDTFHTVNHSRIGDHTLLYSHNVDCIMSKDEYNKSVEEMEFAKLALRYCYYWRQLNHAASWEVRKILWWLDYILSGVDTVYCGEKANGNVLTEIVKIDAKSLPMNSLYPPDDCFENLDSILSLIKKVVTKELVPFKFQHNPGEEPLYLELDEPVENFIPNWFIDHHVRVNL